MAELKGYVGNAEVIFPQILILGRNLSDNQPASVAEHLQVARQVTVGHSVLAKPWRPAVALASVAGFVRIAHALPVLAPH